MGAHLAALPYWSAAWTGSKDEADAFARTAASHAPEGTLLPALPLFAAYDHLPEVNMVRGLYQSEEIASAIEAAEFAVDQVEDDHPVRPHIAAPARVLPRPRRALRRGDGGPARRSTARRRRALGREGDPASAYAAYRALAVAGLRVHGRRPHPALTAVDQPFV